MSSAEACLPLITEAPVIANKLANTPRRVSALWLALYSNKVSGQVGEVVDQVSNIVHNIVQETSNL
jgi:hypothetical protein